MSRPELLAPAGGRDALVAAIQSGADAVYLGAGRFNARQSADNFGGQSLADAVNYAHARNVRVHVTLNTLVREDERSALIQSIEEIAQAGADAVLVQDFGVAKLVREIVPEMPLHASTQMAAHNPAAVRFLARQGFARAVLAREMSLEEIRECANLGIETEVFVHGALCVACSGQCLFSSMIGGRSGNRGRCAQPCRLPYRLDGCEGYLLSTRDLCAIRLLGELEEAGVSSFKIEGRLKRPEYVCTVVRAYRAVMDHTLQAEDVIADLKQMFNRGGFTEGYLPGVSDTKLIYAARPNHLGVSVGKCIQNGKILLNAPVDASDALVLRAGAKSGGRKSDCMESLSADRAIKLSGGDSGENISCASAKKGDSLIRLVSERQMTQAREYCAQEHRFESIHAALTLRVGEPLSLCVWDDAGNTAEAVGDSVERAKTHGTDVNRIRTQLEKTGATAFRFRNIDIQADEDAFVAISALNAIRREALEKLEALRRAKPYRIQAVQHSQIQAHEFPKAPEIMVQSANAQVLAKAVRMNAHAVFAPEDVRADALNAALNDLPNRFFLAVPMVLGEKSLEGLNAWANAHAERIEGVYLSNIAQFDFSWNTTLRADFSLNAANADAFLQLREWGVERITPSVELTAAQISLLDGERELIVHGFLPLMQLRHCPYRTTHSCEGKHALCRRCDTADDPVTGRTLIDRTGAGFTLRRLATDEGCIVRIMNSVPLMLLKRANRLPKADAWRIITENADEAEDLIRLYTLAGNGVDFKTDSAWAKYETLAATTGHFFRGVE